MGDQVIVKVETATHGGIDQKEKQSVEPKASGADDSVNSALAVIKEEISSSKKALHKGKDSVANSGGEASSIQPHYEENAEDFWVGNSTSGKTTDSANYRPDGNAPYAALVEVSLNMMDVLEDHKVINSLFQDFIFSYASKKIYRQQQARTNRHSTAKK